MLMGQASRQRPVAVTSAVSSMLTWNGEPARNMHNTIINEAQIYSIKAVNSVHRLFFSFRLFILIDFSTN